MTDIGTSTRSELPSVRQLNKATAFAAATAAILLVTTVLPAEYGIDPTGVGSALGLTAMGDGKQAEQQTESGWSASGDQSEQTPINPIWCRKANPGGNKL